MSENDGLAFAALCALCDSQATPEELKEIALVHSGSRELLGDLLIQQPKPCSERVLTAVDKVLDAESVVGLPPTPEHLAGAQWFGVGSTRLAVWPGDIRRLAIGAVVNAANEQGLGCFQPNHKCIDNVLHRAAGPRLREACRDLMARRGPLNAGSTPLLTPGFHLAAEHVLHVTGPMLPTRRPPTAQEVTTLSACYRGCLETAAAAGIRSIAFCCLSTGLFNFPNQAAATIALTTVCQWLADDQAHQAAFDVLVFDVFTQTDAEAYARALPAITAAIAAKIDLRTLPSFEALAKTRAKAAPTGAAAAARADESEVGATMAVIEEVAKCDRLLIVAAAGLSISADLPNNPYHNPRDFAHHYPAVVRYGYRTAYEAMGLAQDANVPPSVRVAFGARHMLNMRYDFPPTPAYAMLLELSRTYAAEDVFCWTSNVDGCFERAGFHGGRVYTTQGDMSKYQCMRIGCGHVWQVEAQLRAIAAATVDGELKDSSLVPRCPSCGAAWPEVRPNLRGGDWFRHAPYEATQRKLLAWLDECVEERARVAILEVGVGPNTPVVTRIPACAFASAVAANGGRPTYLRINPDLRSGRGEDPSGRVSFHQWQASWQALKPLVEGAVAIRRAAVGQSGAEGSAAGAADVDEVDPEEAGGWQRRYHDLMSSLRTPRRS